MSRLKYWVWQLQERRRVKKRVKAYRQMVHNAFKDKDALYEATKDMPIRKGFITNEKEENND